MQIGSQQAVLQHCLHKHPAGRQHPEHLTIPTLLWEDIQAAMPTHGCSSQAATLGHSSRAGSGGSGGGSSGVDSRLEGVLGADLCPRQHQQQGLNRDEHPLAIACKSHRLLSHGRKMRFENSLECKCDQYRRRRSAATPKEGERRRAGELGAHSGR